MVKGATPLAVNKQLHWSFVSLEFQCGVHVGGGGEIYNVLSFFHYSVKLGKKAKPERLNPAELQTGKQYYQGCWYRGFVKWISRYLWISHSPIQCCCGECWGLGKPVFFFLLVSASWSREIPMWWQNNNSARCWVIFFSWGNEHLVCTVVAVLEHSLGTRLQVTLLDWEGTVYSWLLQIKLYGPPFQNLLSSLHLRFIKEESFTFRSVVFKSFFWKKCFHFECNLSNSCPSEDSCNLDYCNFSDCLVVLYCLYLGKSFVGRPFLLCIFQCAVSCELSNTQDHQELQTHC